MHLSLPHPLRTLASVVVAVVATVAAVAAGMPGAQAAPPADHVSKHVAKQVAKAERALDRAVKPQRTKRLAAETLAALQANVDADKELLGTFATREELKGFRTVNYVIVVNVLRKAEKQLADTEVAAVAAPALQGVVATGLTVTATSSKADVRALRAALEAATPDDEGTVED
jgi:hypothetical protein